jgi:hypothetical protein
MIIGKITESDSWKTRQLRTINPTRSTPLNTQSLVFYVLCLYMTCVAQVSGFLLRKSPGFLFTLNLVCGAFNELLDRSI